MREKKEEERQNIRINEQEDVAEDWNDNKPNCNGPSEDFNKWPGRIYGQLEFNMAAQCKK